MTIGDLLIRVIADMKDFQADTVKEAEKAGDKAGAAMSKSLGASLKTAGVKAIGVGLAAAFGIAAKGALELENATARFRAETGATAEQADVMGKAINRIAGEERSSLEAVTDIAIRVKNDMGATGQAAVDLTKTFAQFARVTRQDGAESVKAFDDILDSWGLTADRTNEIMNKLIVSQHKFGGDLSETEDSIARLAPAFRAANFEIDDAIALMGLFGSKGLDAQQGAAAFAKALTKVKSPEELQALIKDIAGTVDPFQRASKAADLFGAKAGAKLANALGGANLDDYKISVDESAGALQHAADVLDNTFSGRIQKAISEATANLREFGAAFGPVLAGAGGLASLFATAGGGSLLKPLLKGLVGFPALFKKTLVNGILAAIVPAHAAGIAVGEAQAAGMAEGMQTSKAMGVAKSAFGAIGKIWGSILGKAFVLGALAVIGVELYEQLQQIQADNANKANDIGKSIGNEIADGTLSGLQQSKAALEKGIADLDLAQGLFGGDARNATVALQAQLAKVNAAIADIERKAARDARSNAEGWGEAIPQGITDGIAAGDDHTYDAIENFRGKAADALSKPVRGIDLYEAARKAGVATMQAFAKGILDSQSVVGAAFAALKNQEQTELSTQEDLAYTIGVLTSKELANGLKDGRAGVRQAAEATQKIALEHLNELARSGKPLGKKAMDELKAGLKSKNPQIRKAADDIRKIIQDHLPPKTGPASEAGKKAGAAAAKGFQKGWSAQNPIVHVDAKLNFIESKLPERATGGPTRAGTPYWVNELTPRTELFVPQTPGYVLTHADAMQAAAQAGGGTTNITVALPTTARPDPFETARQLRRLADLKVL